TESAPTAIYTLSLHDALPIWVAGREDVPGVVGHDERRVVRRDVARDGDLGRGGRIRRAGRQHERHGGCDGAQGEQAGGGTRPWDPHAVDPIDGVASGSGADQAAGSRTRASARKPVSIGGKPAASWSPRGTSGSGSATNRPWFPRGNTASPCSPASSVGRFSVYATTLSATGMIVSRSEEHTSELQSRENLVCRLLLEKKNHGSF